MKLVLFPCLFRVKLFLLIMAGKNFAFKEKSQMLGAHADVITLNNAASLSIYQLRQELTRRGIFDDTFGSDGEKRRITFESCLQVLVAELIKEKNEAERIRAVIIEEGRSAPGETITEKLAREKEERKKAALERSAARQAEKDYFESRKKANEEAAAIKQKN